MTYDRDFDINQSYFEWLCDIVHVDQGDKSWWILFKDLYNKKFYSLIPHDENRAWDGLELREDFMHEIWYPKYMDIDGECSVLEMLIGLARRIDFETSNPYEDSQNDSTVYWFWEMIDNLGLLPFDDDSYVDNGGMHFVNSILNNFVERKYSRNGNGGLFPLEHSRQDQRRVEIWYQMSEYLTEREAV